MEFYDVINSRRMVRELQETPVPSDVLERILGAGLKAPSNDHLRNWEIVVLRDAAEKENALQFVKAFAEKQKQNQGNTAQTAETSQMAETPQMAGTPQQKMYAYAVPRQYSMLMESGCVVMPFFLAKAGMFQSTSVNGLNCFASIWCVIENILLAAASEGLACSLRIPVGSEGAEAAKAVGAPEGYLLACYIGIGYPKEGAVSLEQTERKVQDAVHPGRW